MPLDTFQDICIGSSASTGELCVSLPGGAELCASIPSAIPTTEIELAIDMMSKVNTALAPLNPLFDIAETVLTLAQIVKHLALFEVEEAISKIAGLAEKIESLAKLAPPLSMPVLIIDVIDAIIRYLKATQAQIVRMQGYHERVKSSLEASAETGFDMEDIINCAEASLEDTLAHLGTQADPINRLIGLLNGFLQLLELPCIPSISAPTLDDTFLDLMDTTIEYLEFLRGLIKIPVPFVSIGVDEDDC